MTGPEIKSGEELKEPQKLGYRKVAGVYLGTQEECIFARDPNEESSSMNLGGDYLVGERPTLEKDITAKLKAMPNLRTISIVESPISGGWKFELADGWDGKSGALVVVNKKLYSVCISSYSTGDDGSRGNFLIQEVSPDVRLVGNVMHAQDLDNMLRLELWEKPVASCRVGRKNVLVPRRWGGKVIIEGANPAGLIADVLGVINEKTKQNNIPIWRQNKI